MQHLSSNQTTQRQFEAEMVPGGFGIQTQSRPRLTAKRNVAEDGKLTCQWI